VSLYVWEKKKNMPQLLQKHNVKTTIFTKLKKAHLLGCKRLSVSPLELVGFLVLQITSVLVVVE
jgi:hypothetical protein